VCQLTLTNLKNSDSNTNYVYFQSFINSDVRNKHGWGIFCNELIKLDNDASMTTNLITFIKSSIGKSDSPVISHCRFATSFVNAKKEVGVDGSAKSHPFENDSFVLAHNGTLIFIDENNYTEDHNGLIDSEVFLFEMTKEYKKNGDDFVKAIQDTMKKFWGKFGFLIYEKKNKTYWVVRGNATLYKLDILEGGFIINTERDSLVKAAVLVANMLRYKGKTFTFDDNKIELLKQETIFKVDGNDLIEMGEIKVNPEPPKVVEKTKSFPTTATKSYHQRVNDKVCSTVNKIFNFLDETQLTMADLETIFYAQNKKGLLWGDEKEFDSFTDLLELLLVHYTKRKEKLSYELEDLAIFSGEEYEFPYFLESQFVLQELVKTSKANNANSIQ